MGRFSDALKAEVGSYDDSEWQGQLGGHEVTLVTQPINSKDISEISRKHPNFTVAPSPEAMVDLMILKCRDENGTKAFDRGDKPFLMRVKTDKIGEIFGELFGGQLDEYTEDDVEDDVKN